jgi:hypothetical protein
MRRLITIPLLYLGLLYVAYGQGLNLTGTGGSAAVVAVAYSGPGNVVAGAKIFWGLRAYTAALANAGATTTPVIDVRGVGTGTGCTIYLKGTGTGDLDLTTAGAGGVGNQCSGGATTFCTVTNTSCTVSKIYDQTGSGNHAIQATAGKQPTLTFNCFSGKPCLTFVGGAAVLADAGFADASASFSMAADFQNVAGVNSQIIMGAPNGAIITDQSGAPNTFLIYAQGITVNVTAAADGDHHNAMGVVTAGQTTVQTYVNGINDSLLFNANGTFTFAAGMFMGDTSTTPAAPYSGKIAETMFWASALTGTQAVNICHNQFIYWGASGAC